MMGVSKMDATQAPMIDVRICFFLLDDSPWVGLFYKDDNGYGYCEGIMVSEPNGHPIKNIDEYRLTTVSVPVKSDGSYNPPEIIDKLRDGIDDIIDNNEYDWDAWAKQSIALWESVFGQTERHAW